MQAFEIHVDQEYGYREAPTRGGELQHVKVLDHVRSKWKVEWVDPHRGLQDYVRSVQLVVPWKERRAFLTEEENWQRLTEVCGRTWPGHSHPLSEAVDAVFDSTGEIVWVDNHGSLSASPDAIERIGRRAGYAPPMVPPAFVDRQGAAHYPFDTAVTLAQTFATAEPQTVLMEVETNQEKYEREAREIGNSHLVPLVNRWRAGWALCRQWEGFDQALAQRDAEIERLRRIVEDLRYELRRAGEDELAARLDRKLGR